MSRNIRTYLKPDVFHFNSPACPLSRQWIFDVPVHAGSLTFRSADAMLGASKFPRDPKLQNDIANAPSPRDARIIARSRAPANLSLWQRHRIDIMRWILRAKHEANPQVISAILQETGDTPIVDHNDGDRFWAATLEDETFTGVNAHGRLWQELRQHIRQEDPMRLEANWRIHLGTEVLGAMFSPLRTATH